MCLGSKIEWIPGIKSCETLLHIEKTQLRIFEPYISQLGNFKKMLQCACPYLFPSPESYCWSFALWPNLRSISCFSTRSCSSETYSCPDTSIPEMLKTYFRSLLQKLIKRPHCETVRKRFFISWERIIMQCNLDCKMSTSIFFPFWQQKKLNILSQVYG